MASTTAMVAAIASVALYSTDPTEELVPGPPPQLDVSAIDALLTSYAQREIFSGEALVAVGDQVLLHQRYGFRDWSRRAPLQQGSIFKIGSVTKQFTAAAILRLETQGRLSTGDPLATYIPELPDALAGRDGEPVTIHHLVTHTSGFPDPIFANVWGPEQGFDTLITSVREDALRHVPGAEFHYNNTGYVLLGEIIRRVTGTSFEQFLRRELFEPLEMRSTGVKLDRAQRDRLARGHVSNLLTLVPSTDAFGRFVTGSYEWDLFANGNVSSSVADLHRWVRSLQKEELFTPEVMAKLRAPGLRDYAYGWVRRTVEGLGEPLYWHNGAIIPFGYTANVGWTQQRELCVIILSNLDDTAVAQNLFENVMRIVTGVPVEPAKAGFAANGSYLTVQILALVLGTSLLALLLVAYLLWLLLLRQHRSRVQLYSDVAGAISMALLVAVIIDRWSGTLAVVLAVVLAAWAGWRSRHEPLLHTTPWKQRLAVGANALSAMLVLGLAAFIVYYF